VTIDLDGRPAAGDAVPPMEFHLHTEICRRRPDVHAIVHTHPLWWTLFSMTGQPVLAMTMPAAVLGEIRRFDRTASIHWRGSSGFRMTRLANFQAATRAAPGQLRS
jgi:L-ribulose-5-phosphate 4-epimerase